MDSRSMLKVFTIAYCFVYCSADINKEEHVVNDNSTAATTGGALDELSDLASILFNALDKKNGTIITPPAPLIDLKSFEGKKLPEIIESLKKENALNDNNLKSFEDLFDKSDDKLDVKTLTEINDFFKNKTIFGNLDTSDVTKLLDGQVKVLEKEMNKINKKNGGGRIGDRILTMVIPLFIIIFVSH